MKTTYKLLLGVVIVGVVAAGGWWAFSAQTGDILANLSANAGEKLTDAQVQAVISRVSKFMVVPSDEKPSVVVLRGTAELAAQQPFYRDAKDGDVLIVYSSRAIIYDAKANKLVSVSPIQQNTATPVPSTVASGSAQVTPTPTPSGTPVAPEKSTIEVRNGTSTSGLAGKMASDLKTKFGGTKGWVTSTKTGDAKGTYTATVLVDLTGGKKPGALAALEAYTGAKGVTSMPKGEVTSTDDFVIIIGK
jgi:hypothetical protein